MKLFPHAGFAGTGSSFPAKCPFLCFHPACVKPSMFRLRAFKPHPMEWAPWSIQHKELSDTIKSGFSSYARHIHMHTVVIRWQIVPQGKAPISGHSACAMARRPFSLRWHSSPPKKARPLSALHAKKKQKGMRCIYCAWLFGIFKDRLGMWTIHIQERRHSLHGSTI